MTTDEKIEALEVLKGVTEAAARLLPKGDQTAADIAKVAMTLAQDYLRAGRDPIGEIVAIRTSRPAVEDADQAADLAIDAKFGKAP